MFKKFIKMLSLLMVLMIGLSLISCGKGPKRFVSGDFVYTKWECDEGEVRIIGLSEEGQKKETLIFPAMIDGYVVYSIGVRFGFKIINDVVITFINRPSNYGVSPVDIDKVTVKLKGVSDVVNNITASDVRAYVNLEGLGTGTQTLDIIVEGNDPRVEYLSSVLKVQVRIYERE